VKRIQETLLLMVALLALVPISTAQAADVNVKSFGASGSGNSFIGTVSGGSSSLSLNSPGDFAQGQGIKIEHAGPACHFGNGPCGSGPAPSVRPHGKGSFIYAYRIACIDDHGGIGPAGPQVAASNSQLDATKAIANMLTWRQPPGATACAIYRSGRLVAVTSTSNFTDWGQVYYPGIVLPDIPANPPAVALSDSLVTTVMSASGSAVGLQAPASSAARNVSVKHDDSAALTQAFAALSSGSTLRFAPGTYLFSVEGFSIPASNVKILGAGQNNTTIMDDNLGNSFLPCSHPTEPCGIITAVDLSNIEIGNLGLYGLGDFGQQAKANKKGIYAHAQWNHVINSLYVHDVLARHIEGEAIYTDGGPPGGTGITYTHDAVIDSSKIGLNSNDQFNHNVVITDNFTRDVSAAAIDVAARSAVIARNQIIYTRPVGVTAINLDLPNQLVLADNKIIGANFTLAAVPPIKIGMAVKEGTNQAYMAQHYGSVSGIVVGNVISNNVVASETTGGAIEIDDVKGPLLVTGNVISHNGRPGFGGRCPAISIKNGSDKVLIENNQIEGGPGDQTIGVRIEPSVPGNNHIIIGKNSVSAPIPQDYKVNPGGGDVHQFDSLLQKAQTIPPAH
jgi:hypothetical protein